MSRLALAVLAAAIAAACAERAPNVRAAAAEPSAACATCHAAIADEWRASFHRASFTDATYQASLALEERKEHAFCNGCHAPVADRSAGVDCVACHGTAAHEDKRPVACARCHEFAFDGRPELVQKTVS